MSLTPTQLTTFRDDIAANTAEIIYSGATSAINAAPDTPDANQAIAEWYNQKADPDFFVFVTSIPTEAILRVLQDNLAELTSFGGNATERLVRLDIIGLVLKNGVFNPTPVATRNGMLDLFPSAQADSIRNGLLAISWRLANYAEKLFAIPTTGPVGGDGSSNTANAALVFEGNVNRFDVADARNS